MPVLLACSPPCDLHPVAHSRSRGFWKWGSGVLGRWFYWRGLSTSSVMNNLRVWYLSGSWEPNVCMEECRTGFPSTHSRASILRFTSKGTRDQGLPSILQSVLVTSSLMTWSCFGISFFLLSSDVFGKKILGSVLYSLSCYMSILKFRAFPI